MKKISIFRQIFWEDLFYWIALKASANKKWWHLRRGGRYMYPAVLLRLIITALAVNLWDLIQYNLEMSKNFHKKS